MSMIGGMAVTILGVIEEQSRATDKAISLGVPPKEAAKVGEATAKAFAAGVLATNYGGKSAPQINKTLKSVGRNNEIQELPQVRKGLPRK